MVDALVTDTSMVIKRDEFIRRIREAITAIHTSAFFDKDVLEDFIRLESNTHSNFSIPYPERHRAFKSIVPMTINGVPIPVCNKFGKYKKTDITSLRTMDGATKTDVYYNAGGKVNIIASQPPTALAISWYSEPEVADPTLETWIMKQYPQFVMDWALAKFYKVNGKEKLARSIEATLFRIDLQNLINNHASAHEI